MKLFGNSKNGKHTADGGNSRRERREYEEEAVYEEPLPPEQPEAPIPVEEEPRPAEPPARLWQAPVNPKSKQEQEDGLFNSIVEAVGMMDQLPTEPEQPEKRSEQPAPKRTERVEPPKRPEPRDPFPDDFPEDPSDGKKGKKAIIIVGSILGVLLLIAIAALVVVHFWVTAPNADDVSGLVTPVPTHNQGDVVDDDPPDHGTQTGRKEGNFTFTIVGADVASGNTDVILVGKLDTVEGTLNVCSIPRDTLINYGINRINSAYAIGENKGGSGVDNLKKELKKLMGFEIDNYAVVDTKAVAELIDAIGGVYFDVPQDMVYNDPYQDLNINIKKGYQLLSGADAVKVLRFRDGYAGGDIQRIGVQQDFFKAIAKQLLDLKNIPNMNAAIEIYNKRVETDLKPENVAWYLTQFLKLDFDNINFMTLPGNTNGSINGASYVFIHVDEWLEMVNDYLNPFYEQVTENHVSIKTSTDGTSLWTTAGAANY